MTKREKEHLIEKIQLDVNLFIEEFRSKFDLSRNSNATKSFDQKIHGLESILDMYFENLKDDQSDIEQKNAPLINLDIRDSLITLVDDSLIDELAMYEEMFKQCSDHGDEYLSLSCMQTAAILSHQRMKEVLLD